MRYVFKNGRWRKVKLQTLKDGENLGLGDGRGWGCFLSRGEGSGLGSGIGYSDGYGDMHGTGGGQGWKA